jgi:hypothetical protein
VEQVIDCITEIQNCIIVNCLQVSCNSTEFFFATITYTVHYFTIFFNVAKLTGWKTDMDTGSQKDKLIFYYSVKQYYTRKERKFIHSPGKFTFSFSLAAYIYNLRLEAEYT